VEGELFHASERTLTMMPLLLISQTLLNTAVLLIIFLGNLSCKHTKHGPLKTAQGQSQINNLTTSARCTIFLSGNGTAITDARNPLPFTAAICWCYGKLSSIFRSFPQPSLTLTGMTGFQQLISRAVQSKVLISFASNISCYNLAG